MPDPKGCPALARAHLTIVRCNTAVRSTRVGTMVAGSEIHPWPRIDIDECQNAFHGRAKFLDSSIIGELSRKAPTQGHPRGGARRVNHSHRQRRVSEIGMKCVHDRGPLTGHGATQKFTLWRSYRYGVQIWIGGDRDRVWQRAFHANRYSNPVTKRVLEAEANLTGSKARRRSSWYPRSPAGRFVQALELVRGR
jgi:hypothetical protein